MAASPYCPRCGAANPPSGTTCFACGGLLDVVPGAHADLGLRRELRGRYRLRRQIGTGGFGAVYQAEDAQLGGRLVAVKELSPRGLSPEEAREATERFHREALLLAGLSHPNLPRIHEYFEESGCWYLVMEFIAGQTLEHYLLQRGGSLPAREALQMALALAGVLGYLHTRVPPIVFRDLKPANVMRTPAGQLFLIDFGIARLFKPGQARDTMAFGSPGYAAPEQYGKAQTTPRSDVFSLGALLHHLLTGADPSETPFRFAPLTMPRPAGTSALIERMVDLDAARRPETVELVRQALERMLTDAAPWRADEAHALAPRPPAAAPPPVANAYPPLAPASLSGQGLSAIAGTRGAPGVSPPAGKRIRWGRWVALAATLCTVIACCVGLNLWRGVAPPTGNGTGAGGSGEAPITLHTITPVPDSVPVYALAWSPDGAVLAYGGATGNLELEDLRTGQQTTVDTGMAQITALAWSPDGTALAAGGDSGRIDLVHADGNVASRYAVATANINALSWSPDGRRLALAASDGTVRTVDAPTGDQRTTLELGLQPVAEVAWSPDGASIAFDTGDPWVHVWGSATGTDEYDYRDDRAAIGAFAWSPDGARIASADADGQVQVWDALTGDGRSTYAPAGTAGGVNALGWSPDGRYVAAGGDADQVVVWAPGAATPRSTYTRQSGSIHAVAWAPAGDRIASASEDGTVQVWDALTGTQEQTYWLQYQNP